MLLDKIVSNSVDNLKSNERYFRTKLSVALLYRDPNKKITIRVFKVFLIFVRN